MPLSRIESFRTRWGEEVEQMIEALYQAQQQTLSLPAHDRQIRYIEYPAGHYALPPGQTSNYLILEIMLFSGRSPETKKALYQAIIKNFGELGFKPEEIFIVLNEQPPENWGIRGGQPASEVNLGFKANPLV